ncbi:MAG: hypothetical protein ABI574_04705 [Burkholderiales bacterium]
MKTAALRCIVCGKPTHLKAQAAVGNGMLANVRECEDDPTHRFDTVEVPAAVASQLGKAAVARIVRSVKRGMVDKAEASRRRTTVRGLMGHRTAADIARFLGITSARVNQLIAELKKDEPGVQCMPVQIGGYRSRIHRIE